MTTEDRDKFATWLRAAGSGRTARRSEPCLIELEEEPIKLGRLAGGAEDDAFETALFG
jgi:hypothetical protein